MSKISCNSIKDPGFSRPKPVKPNFDKPSTWGAGSDNGKVPYNDQESATNPVDKVSCNSVKDPGFSRPKPVELNCEKPLTWGAGSDNGKIPYNDQESATNPVDKVCPEIQAAIRGGGGSVEVDSATPMTGGGKVRADKIDSVISGLLSSFAN